MKPKGLLVHPPIYDFSAYDFWLKPSGLLHAGGQFRSFADLTLFDYLNRLHPQALKDKTCRNDSFGRGTFPSCCVEKPELFAEIPRHFKRFGLSREIFHNFLSSQKGFDFAFIATSMTYWYPGVKEVICDIRQHNRDTTIVLGGIYATLCSEHAATLGADFVLKGSELKPLWKYLGFPDMPERNKPEPSFWEGYSRLQTGVLKLSDGCPFKCSYCSVPAFYPQFKRREPETAYQNFKLLTEKKVKQIAFYDDSLLYKPKEVLIPFLKKIKHKQGNVTFHTPNALNARFITQEIAEILLKSNFRTFFLGFESSSPKWQRQTGDKVRKNDLEKAIDHLLSCGADRQNITAYLMLGHPDHKLQDLEASMQFVNSLGIRVMLSEFSPIPGTEDGDKCREKMDLTDPLSHNKTAFTLKSLGKETVNRIKGLCHQLNNAL